MLNYNFHPAQKNSNKLLVLLHGFISDHSSFDHLLTSFTDDVNVLTIDLPGHGNDATASDEEWNFNAISHYLDETLEAFSSYDIYLHGYSMGGRVALYYALNGKMTLQGLILESTSAGIDSEENRVERQQVDNARAKVLDIAGLEVFVNDWEKLPLFQTQYDLDKSIQRRIRTMRMNQDPSRLAQALRDYGTGNMPNLWQSIKNIQIPTLIIVGELDRKFCEISQRLTTEISTSEVIKISNAGHTVHVEDAEEFGKIVLGFLFKEEQND
ncbi:2-succinyl-6-hydroxy-2,4-cyclohexadiene-1-carboxylate synthase [Staphylococcus sp. 18_1_E_LY]|uniref:Putative 2-succinyl-6-hydroxy-2,4-cyclohexadiene-1-carboxylate synthase n=1 Tax=Staphylococcus lloydii TaxID=2781774 RepID=A0A7T1AYF5_9STAP|nr:2-succinyl-6-hydroxy-2,4-cyclohexadiene-1-carboxylate synthase [Staphylococcus lloydii]MBF7019052.1 2-succinyl-6-hydroxy-2,4-cyclohexadiene-1-carboxylate synthase [Staphylococcus lloydii]MBF7026780.1 2-succinyl-6-hydroxy-2,4-cyclohexadiene-1-carboxylate synthase [Staphylococcus lloydii]MDU9417325.1 2-succinyl-6-hydroxy-2,4-cyclohexadiene-1-carboxylate synthase [Staphylococcus lloydii]QPM74437.1 2-succinyl-6-hydroxy-2,4-cyclohexadiene-1-carboxylate synthase [Staphylococcus lloydii]